MENHTKFLGIVVALLLVIVGIQFYSIPVGRQIQPEVAAPASSSLITGAVVGFSGYPSNPSSILTATDCWRQSSSGACQQATGCMWNSQGNFCERAQCWYGERTNETYCETTLNQSYNLSCTWSNASGGEMCFPGGGQFFGSGCSDYDGNQQGCRDSNHCMWNATGSRCQEPFGEFSGGSGSQVFNPGCGVISVQDICINISGCSWSANACSGNPTGVSCSNLNQSICSTFTMLNTCCTWNGTSCRTSYDQGCKNNMQQFPTGANYCEDTNSFKNQTLCEQIAGSPWYMPCSWNNRTNECHFNSDGFGDSSSFGEINTKVACDAQGGSWKTEQFTSGGMLKTDSWCEFNFGSGGNCDSACWACENQVSSSSNTTTQARSLCQNSTLGFCEFRSDSYAFNGLGWCNPAQDFIFGGAKSCDDVCSACDFLNDPRTQCQGSAKQCTFVNDSSASNGVGNCYDQSEKYCGNDCFSCYDSTNCLENGNGGNGSCNWDTFNGFCKPVGFTGEICFNGFDDDNDQKIDCADSGCSSDKFCGGSSLSEQMSNCPSYSTNNTCSTNGCVWLLDSFDQQFGGSGYCDFPGAQCWAQDGNSVACNATAGCSYLTTAGGFCEINETLFDTCFSARNQSACGLRLGCGWNTGGSGFSGPGGQGGWCEPVLFSQCHGNSSRRQSQAGCEANSSIGGQPTQICRWNTQWNPAGECEPLCFSTSSSDCQNSSIIRGLCEVMTGICEPTAFGGNCYQADGNQTRCNGPLNSTCTYFPDTLAINNVSASELAGWCESKVEAGFVSQMGNKQPTILGTDLPDNTIHPHLDIMGVGVMDEFDSYMIGMQTTNFSLAATCNNIPVKLTDGPPNFFEPMPTGTGSRNSTFYWYFDSDGNSTNNCASRNNASTAGFEFAFKYSGKWSTSLDEVKISYQCVNGSWGPVPIPLGVSSQLMCSKVGGPVIGIQKTELFKFRALYNKTANLRVYVTSGNNSNDSITLDNAGPFYYSPGSFDARFEDCENSGGDADGDGLIASMDPDCVNFLKFGFVPSEAGFQCGDGLDNDADGLTDCSDYGCSMDQYFCGGTLEADPNDKTSPKVTWFKVDPFPDSAFVIYDTNEPANGTLSFYSNDSTCTTLNATVLDHGLYNSNMQNYSMWHNAPLDSYSFNPQRLPYTLTNATTYYLKTTVCDISGNCAVSGCLNFTTKGSFASCKSCSSTFTFPFQPQQNSAVTDPLGNLKFTFELSDGTRSDLAGNASSGVQLNYTQSKSFNMVIENPNTTSSEYWKIVLVNASLGGKVSSSAQNITAGTDIAFNSTSTGKFIGLGTSKCQELINSFRPSKLQMGIPGNVSDLWQCSSNLANCSNKTSAATRLIYNTTLNTTIWEVPAEWGC